MKRQRENRENRERERKSIEKESDDHHAWSFGSTSLLLLESGCCDVMSPFIGCDLSLSLSLSLVFTQQRKRKRKRIESDWTFAIKASCYSRTFLDSWTERRKRASLPPVSSHPRSPPFTSLLHSLPVSILILVSSQSPNLTSPEFHRICASERIASFSVWTYSLIFICSTFSLSLYSFSLPLSPLILSRFHPPPSPDFSSCDSFSLNVSFTHRILLSFVTFWLSAST